MGNPLLNKPDFNIKRRWDDDVVFKNQARGTEDKNKKKEFINVSSQPPAPNKTACFPADAYPRTSSGRTSTSA